MRPLFFYRVGRWAYVRGIPLIPWLAHRLCLWTCSADIPMSCEIGDGVEFGHFGLGVVINGQAHIGNGVIIYHGVTIGRSRGIVDRAAQSFEGIWIGDNTLIGAHAIILAKGPRLTIGRNCEIGAGAVLLEDMPDNSIAVGNPAKVRNRVAQIRNVVGNA